MSAFARAAAVAAVLLVPAAPAYAPPPIPVHPHAPGAVPGRPTPIPQASRPKAIVAPRLSPSSAGGGPSVGAFLQVVDEPQEDLEVPGESYTFGTLIRAQADGDLQTLRSHGLEAVRAGREIL